MRKCLDCERELPDVAMKCSECGSANLSEIITAAPPALSERKAPKIKLSRPVIIAIAVVLIVAVLAGVGLYVFNRYRVTSPVVIGVQSMYRGDVDGYALQYPPALRDSVTENMTTGMGLTAEEYRTQQQQSLSELYGEQYTVSVSALDMQRCSDGILAALNESYSDEEQGVSITQARYVTVKIFIRGDSGAETVFSRTAYSVKVDGSWYLLEDFAGEQSE